MPIDPQVQLAFTFAADVAKQLITISTALITFSVTFSKEVVQTIPKRPRRILFASWVLNLSSILFGLLVLLFLTGMLAPTAAVANEPIAIDLRVRIAASLQLLCFVIGIVLMVLYGRAALRQAVHRSREQANVKGKSM
jgi:membrane associated rhomboid family serine protease